MKNVVRAMLAIKKYAGILTTISWLVFVTLFALSVALLAFGTVTQNMFNNMFLSTTGLLAGGFPLVFFLAMVYFYPHEDDGRSFQQRFGGAAAKSLRVIGIAAACIAIAATILGMLSDPVVIFARWLYHDVWPFGKSLSKAFTATWATLMLICLVLLVRMKSFALALEVGMELIKESWTEIFEFYKDILEYMRRPAAS